mmetsp:Transcript_42442/g.120440  ORF Transcript_42442/g.120440 Transcript_42442/m.120440 type:complete len:222 (-) Transcript_42442:792-1457(-)
MTIVQDDDNSGTAVDALHADDTDLTSRPSFPFYRHLSPQLPPDSNRTMRVIGRCSEVDNVSPPAAGGRGEAAIIGADGMMDRQDRTMNGHHDDDSDPDDRDGEDVMRQYERRKVEAARRIHMIGDSSAALGGGSGHKPRPHHSHSHHDHHHHRRPITGDESCGSDSTRPTRNPIKRTEDDSSRGAEVDPGVDGDEEDNTEDEGTDDDEPTDRQMGQRRQHK